MATEGPIQFSENGNFTKSCLQAPQHISTYPAKLEGFPNPPPNEQQHSQAPAQSHGPSSAPQTHQPQQPGSLMRSYSFLADHICRSVSNPLYKLVRTVEDNVGGEALCKQPEETLQNVYQSHQAPGANLKFESTGAFESKNMSKMVEQPQQQSQEASPHPVQEQQNFSAWETNATTAAHHWYPRNISDIQQPSSETYRSQGANWPPGQRLQSRRSKPETAPTQPQLRANASTKTPQEFNHQQGQHQNRYHQQYFQEWSEVHHTSTSANAASYYSRQHFDPSLAAGASESPSIRDDLMFPSQTGNVISAEASACPGCFLPTANAPHQSTGYPEAGSELHNGLSLVDPMRTLPRYLTTGLWPPVISPSKSEWNLNPGVSEDEAQLLEANRFYGDGNCRINGATGASNIYQGYVGGMQDTKDFFFTSGRYSAAGDAVFRHKADAHRLSVSTAASAMECDPQELEAFAERFKQRRIKLGVTQADVGKALGRLNLAGVGSFSQSTICRFESLTLSHNNMLALKPILQAWLDEAEQEAMARQKNPGAYDVEEDDKKRKRTSITDPEKRSLEAFFGIQPRPSSEKIAQIAEKLNLKKNVVRVWFCNQRQKQKRMKFSTVGLLHQVNGM